jgi:PAS domain S-box-containing protein
MAGNSSNEWLSKQGERYLIEWSNALLRGADGNVEFLVCVGTDVTERRRAAQQLLLKNAALEHALNGIAMADLEGRLRYVNPAFLKLWGYADSGAVLGRLATEFWAQPEQAALVIAALQQHGQWAGALEGLHANGGKIVLELTAVLIRDAAAQPIQMLASFVDITARRHSEESLRQSEALLRHTQAISHVGSWVLDHTTDILKWSEETCRIFGRDPNRYGNNYAMFLDAVHPADRDRVDQAYQTAIARHAPYDITHRILRPDGSMRWVQERGETAYDAQGKALRTIGAVQDITERKAAEDALRANNQITAAVLDTTPVLIAYLDPNMNFVRVNRAYAAADHKDPEYFVGKNHFALYPHAENEAIFRRVLATGEPHATHAKPFEYEHNPERGTTHWDWTLTPIKDGKDGNGKVSGLVLSLTNVTDRIEALEAAERSELALMALTESLEARILDRTRDLSLAKESAERANRAKSEFLSRMSHELRTPMNAILGFAQVLELESIAPEHKDYIQEIHRAGDHLLELINELLDLSRIETGKLAVLVQPISLQAVLSQALQIMQAMREERQIALLHYCQSEVRVLADATRLRQILVNLLSNAVKYNHAGGRITIACQPQSDAVLRIAVADTGPGIAPEKQHLLFRPFERLGAELSGVEGVGIGLALSKQLAELMGAKIGVDSTPGVGSTFWLDLALVPASMPLTSSTANEYQPPVKESRHKCSVLYVEDNAANLKLVEVLLRRQPDINLITASNGEYGLELARRYQPDAILLDIHLPGMDGYALLDVLQADAATSAIPVLALSADAMPVDVERGLQAGFKRYLTKPIDGKELIAAIREVV